MLQQDIDQGLGNMAPLRSQHHHATLLLDIQSSISNYLAPPSTREGAPHPADELGLASHGTTQVTFAFAKPLALASWTVGGLLFEAEEDQAFTTDGRLCWGRSWGRRRRESTRKRGRKGMR